ncbi:Na+/H+ antiporter NhaC family protein [Natronincola ferrireducens]|uniref:Na+/H+ antiporter NhaC n=1 Tax=Natronincola ferrireducens TaxID=393762 RepID=A0A1G8YJK3_9FIRM|nr:Na+/H+ antiporter NhaC family protein [Natronincola ferrireducens]SDK03059.1 Na+/H+ antiporter NhaC [Natronincola ferrireducens]
MTTLTKLTKDDKVRKNMLFYGILIISFIIIGFLVPGDPTDFGIISAIPAAFLIIFIFKTKRIIEALTLALLLTTIMGYKGEFFGVFNEIILENLMNEDMAWLFIVCGLMGGIVALVESSGGGYAFGSWVIQKAKTPKSSMLWTAICSIFLSIDDYLSVLTTGCAMTPINDRHKIPREMTAYIVDSAAAPACVLNPISTWAVFIGGLMVANGLGEPGQQVLTYVKTIPYNFYAMAALVVLFLVIIGVIPVFGPMKRAFERVQAGGPLAPPGSERIDIRGGKEQEVPENPKLRNFFVPMLVLISATIFFEFDMQMGVVAAIGFNFVWFVLQGMSPEGFVDEVLRGLKNMITPLLMMVLAFSFADGCERIGFMEYVVDVATEHITLQYLPLTVFLVFAFTEFIMGINWGMYIIAIPMVVPITLALGGDPIVMVGVVAAAGVWGSHCCFYSDATILTSAGTGCENFRHAITQIPFGFIAGIIAAIGYLAMGFILY